MMSLELSHYPLPTELREVFKRVDEYLATMAFLKRKVEKVEVYSDIHQKSRGFLKKVTGTQVGTNKTITYKGVPVVDGGPKAKRCKR